ncbi:MAG: DUF2207 domain-containing protein [Kiloniellales bacterium]
MRLRIGLRLLCLTLLLAAGTAASAAIQPAAARSGGDPDRLPRFSADIAVQENGDLLVTEEIDFLVTPGSRKRGIFRDLPTAYRTVLGLTERVGYELLQVTRDGNPEHYEIEPGSTSLRVRIGQKSVFLNEGLHRYRITYRTDRQLLFLEETDELYWNVTGNDWAHPIDRAEARIRLPAGAEVVESTAYTGYYGETGEDFTQSSTPEGSLFFASTRTLRPGEGLTIAVSWPTGLIARPSFTTRATDSLSDNLGLLVMLAGLPLLLIYFTWQWRRVGRDPDKGVVIPRFEPPEGLSPAATGHIWGLPRGGFDHAKAFAVALTSLAVKGRLMIDDEEDHFTLQGRGPRDWDSIKDVLPPGEAEVLDALFPPGSDRIVIQPSYTPVVSEAVRRLSKALRDNYDQPYYRANTTVWGVGGVLAGIAGLGGLALQVRELDITILLPIIIVFCGAPQFVFSLVGSKLWPSVFELLEGRVVKARNILFAAAFALLLGVVPLASLYLVFSVHGVIPAALLAALLLVVGLFWHLLKAPTPLGREVFDQIEGYRLYLSVAERDRLNVLTAEPEMTLEAFEHHLPYAMALGVEEQWSGRFLAAARPASLEQAKRQPHWYRSTRLRSPHLRLADLGSRLSGGLSRTLSMAAKSPNNRSGGSRGGGFSGGGRGGGGGGSW